MVPNAIMRTVLSRGGYGSRALSTSARRLQTPSGALPVRKPVGAFRGGLFGFLFGSLAAGAGMYFYVLNEYKVSNDLLQEDIYNLQSAVQRIEGYVKTLEDRVAKQMK
ncbi:hypothetical protein L228DRAFT_237326 [Xylona heveae TC161]|uniref:Uncharacterized protein n=1 Tax=Xylona heveae (strain CBS 132557 / TC161) TaxID=1328760 RepID=A0A165I4W9_XYLHT|nr:hypothetical protein L228DRAFT_237326 [Xylona heveae TC161]KZF24388.1 hypothetical protein L228DRAFT_237326 [Xylona heveae TC161]